MEKKYSRKQMVSASFIEKFKYSMNLKDKDYFQASIEAVLPIFIAFIFLLGVVFVSGANKTNPLPPLLRKFTLSGFFLINSMTGIIMMYKRRMANKFYVIRGRSAVITGLILFCVSILLAFMSLWI
jgi:hypothetical protein